MSKCEKCFLHESCSSPGLTDSVKPNARIMVIGDQPSIVDDMSEEPFTDSSGNLIRNLLGDRGYKDEDIYFSYVVKCRLMRNEDPTKESIESCTPQIAEEMKNHPKLEMVILLGNIALKALTGRSGIGTYRGTEFNVHGVKALATYHPGAVLRTPKLMTSFKADLNKAINIMSGNVSNVDAIDIRYVTSRESLTDMIRHLKKCQESPNFHGSCDVETTTFDYWRPETKIMTMALCGDGITAWAIPLFHPQSPWRSQTDKLMNMLKPILETGKWVGNNWKYDRKWIRSKYNIDVNFGPDNMLISYANDENIPHDLKYQAAVHCGAPAYSKDINWPTKYDPVVDNIVDKVNQYLRMDLKKLLKYNALDSYYTWHVYPIERGMLMENKRMARIYKYLLEHGSYIFMFIEENGMWIDPERLAKAMSECEKKLEATMAELNALIPQGWQERNLSKKQLKEGFNWNSTKQLGSLFFQEDGFNFPILLRTSTGNPSTAESVLIELNSEVDHPALNKLMEYRKWAKYMNTYLQPWSHKVDSNSRIHPNFKLHGTVTGRMSGEDGVHQVPRDKFIRSLIGAPPGWTFFEIDGSQIELRVAAAVANEREMLRIFALDGDIHRETAAVVTGKDPADVTSDERKKAKAVNFGFLYGMGWKKFKQYAWEKYGIRLTDKEAKDYRKRFFEKYPDLPAWHARMRKLVRATGVVVSPIGRYRRLHDIFSVDEDMQSAAEREAINSPVQGFGSDYVLAAFIEVVMEHIMVKDPEFKQIKPVGAVHDAQYYEVRNDVLEEWATLIKQIFDDPARLKKWFNYVPPVMITGDCKLGNHWGDAKDWNIGEPFPHEMR